MPASTAGSASTNAMANGMKKRTNAGHHPTGDPSTRTTLSRRLRIPNVCPVRRGRRHEVEQAEHEDGDRDRCTACPRCCRASVGHPSCRSCLRGARRLLESRRRATSFSAFVDWPLLSAEAFCRLAVLASFEARPACRGACRPCRDLLDDVGVVALDHRGQEEAACRCRSPRGRRCRTASPCPAAAARRAACRRAARSSARVGCAGSSAAPSPCRCRSWRRPRSPSAAAARAASASRSAAARCPPAVRRRRRRPARRRRRPVRRAARRSAGAGTGRTARSTRRGRARPRRGSPAAATRRCPSCRVRPRGRRPAGGAPRGSRRATRRARPRAPRSSCRSCLEAFPQLDRAGRRSGPAPASSSRGHGW